MLELITLQLRSLRDRSEGQTLAEYALILSLIAVACVIALGVLSGAIQGILSSVADQL